ncbi:hypothetical protein FWC63_03175 [Candidatus Saccharibacteria bacterium]|nr:hypothetical protein [Candidatus Saccharibacteria bacterium]
MTNTSRITKFFSKNFEGILGSITCLFPGKSLPLTHSNNPVHIDLRSKLRRLRALQRNIKNLELLPNDAPTPKPRSRRDALQFFPPNATDVAARRLQHQRAVTRRRTDNRLFDLRCEAEDLLAEIQQIAEKHSIEKVFIVNRAITESGREITASTFLDALPNLTCSPDDIGIVPFSWFLEEQVFHAFPLQAIPA